MSWSILGVSWFLWEINILDMDGYHRGFFGLFFWGGPFWLMLRVNINRLKIQLISLILEHNRKTLIRKFFTTFGLLDFSPLSICQIAEGSHFFSGFFSCFSKLTRQYFLDKLFWKLFSCLSRFFWNHRHFLQLRNVDVFGGWVICFRLWGLNCSKQAKCWYNLF